MSVALAPSTVAARSRFDWLAPAALAFAILVVTARAGGAFLPSTWGWSALGPLLAVLAAVLLLETVELARADLSFLGLLGALVLWTGLSAVWSDSVPRTIEEVQRDLVYLGAVIALLLLTRRGTVPALVGGIVAAATAICSFGLATRLFPDRFGLDSSSGGRLARPLGYWNGLGLVAALGILLAVGVAYGARSRGARAGAAAAVPILVATLYFTFSRGSWAALAFGLVVTVSVARDRARLVTQIAALAPVLAGVLWFCSSSRALNDSSAPLADAARAGHRLAPILLALAVVSAAATALLARCPTGLRVSGRVRRRLVAGGVVLALAAGCAVLERAGGPGAVWQHARTAFGSSGWSPSSRLDDRLFSPSGRGRSDYWRVAFGEASAHPWLGSGAGTFDLYWTRERPLALGALDAHSLYLETLAELGPAGLALLCAFLAVPFAGLRRARAQYLAAPAAGAYAAFLVAVGLDWHWELPTVTLCALACAAVVVVSARQPGSSRRLASRAKIAVPAAITVLAVAALVVQMENNALDAGRAAQAAGSDERAAAYARRAMLFAPWSAAPWSLLAAAQSSSGDLAGAHASLRQAVAKDPKDWRLWYDLARSSTGAARRAALAEAKRLNPLAAGS